MSKSRVYKWLKHFQDITSQLNNLILRSGSFLKFVLRVQKMKQSNLWKPAN